MNMYGDCIKWQKPNYFDTDLSGRVGEWRNNWGTLINCTKQGSECGYGCLGLKSIPLSYRKYFLYFFTENSKIITSFEKFCLFFELLCTFSYNLWDKKGRKIKHLP